MTIPSTPPSVSSRPSMQRLVSSSPLTHEVTHVGGGEPTRQKLRRHPSLPIATLRNYLRAICHPRRLVHASSEIAFRERVKISDLGHRTHDLAVTPPVQSISALLRGATCLLTCGWAESTPRRPPRDAQLLALLPSVMASLSVGRTWDLLLTSRRWRR